MTSQPLSLDNGVATVFKPQPVVVRIQELSLCLSSGDRCDESTQGVVKVFGKSRDGLRNGSRSMLDGQGLKRPDDDIGQGQQRTTRPKPRRRSSSLGSLEGFSVGHDDYFSRRIQSASIYKTRSSDAAGPLMARSEKEKHSESCHDVIRDPSRLLDITAAPIKISEPLPTPGWFYPSQVLGQAFNGPCGIVPPLTPPEDLDSFKWETPSQTDSSGGARTVSSYESDSGSQRQSQPRTSSTSRPSEIRMPEPSNMSRDESSRLNWLERACQHLVSSSGDFTSQQQIQMVVQALPSQPRSTHTRPIYDRVVEDVQNHFTSPPYITITHAYFQAISMDEVPASPPATPNTNYPSDDYFQDHTVFTHAAVVPAYHSHVTTFSAVAPRPSNIIAAPSSIQISILERYIPPTTPREVEDFFTLSRRSYLADRLLELSSNEGSLLLIYPTKLGGQTFASRYIGPVIEPFLRQFILLNNLYTDIAIQLGRMDAVASMKSFEEMQTMLLAMCEALSQRAPSRGLPSRYQIIHAETAEVVLDRTLWKEWYIEQEQPRLRQNLVDYHKSGGRMPARSGRIEVTPGMLAREVVDGIRQSRETAGNVGVEVAVFVVRRTTVV
ncbi:hypothetical protein Z517_03373 [Fonsecaea pedrosoi CBS 271.37]|uniref:Uncharacterized protein n=1 Tax=Fonsecaea pedrosoi CBS 271.37 TaxID=1442368 RepID=A0A0D2E246_9EURO|nr:uncharacterized protein Z517_03373 [Fonsecaea pedrosoi CBS 271.37]KIW84126.1 hypothetical protein Z517_03373 [Fonsecaea pedrosoi CBS 271.37]